MCVDVLCFRFGLLDIWGFVLMCLIVMCGCCWCRLMMLWGWYCCWNWILCVFMWWIICWLKVMIS